MKRFFHILLPPLLFALLAQFSVEYVIQEKDKAPYEGIQTDNGTVQKMIVSFHNEIRRKVKPEASNMLKMQWSPQLAESAKKWAELCYLNHSTPEHRTREGHVYGENILKSPAPLFWKVVVNLWVAEKIHLKFGEGAVDNKVVTHYTQLVADNTHECGCAVKDCGEYYFYVCHYYTAGNQQETLYTPYKPGPPCSECKTACDGNKLCLNSCGTADLVQACHWAIEYDICHFPLIQFICGAACLCKGKIT